MAWPAILKAIQMAQAMKGAVNSMKSPDNPEAAPPPWMVQGPQGGPNGDDSLDAMKKRRLQELLAQQQQFASQYQQEYQPYQFQPTQQQQVPW